MGPLGGRGAVGVLGAELWFPFQTREQEELEEALEVERQESEQRRLFMQKEEQLQQMIKRKNKQALLDDLVSNKTRGFECSVALTFISITANCMELIALSLFPCFVCFVFSFFHLLFISMLQTTLVLVG